MKNKKELPENITIKVKVKVKRELYDRLTENAKELGIEQNLKKGLEENAYEWLNYIDEFMKERLKQIVEVNKSPLVGPDGKPMIGSG